MKLILVAILRHVIGACILSLQYFNYIVMVSVEIQSTQIKPPIFKFSHVY